MTLKDLRSSRIYWRTVRPRAKRNHDRYIKLTRNTKAPPGSDRHTFLWSRRTYWSRRLRKAERMIRQRDREIRAREPQQISRAGMDFLIREEGVRRYAYNDSRGHATFGVGHLIHHGPVTDADRRQWGTPENPKSMQVVFDVLDRDLDSRERVVRDTIRGGRIKANRYDAMLSLCFNVGAAGFSTSTVVRRYNAGDIRGAGDAFLLWDEPPEIRPRRGRERSLFLR